MKSDFKGMLLVKPKQEVEVQSKPTTADLGIQKNNIVIQKNLNLMVKHQRSRRQYYSSQIDELKLRYENPRDVQSSNTRKSLENNNVAHFSSTSIPLTESAHFSRQRQLQQ